MSMEKPEIDFPGEAPDDLVIDDIVVGTGDEAKAGDQQRPARRSARKHQPHP